MLALLSPLLAPIGSATTLPSEGSAPPVGTSVPAPVSAVPSEIEATWNLSVDGQPVGTRTIHVRFEGNDATRVRIFEAYTEIDGGRKRQAYSYRQRLTANSHDNAPASFHSVIESDGEPREIQARFAEDGWNVTVAEPSGTRTHRLPPTRVDLSTVDLFDPESDRRIAPTASARILSADIGKILDGPVTALGPSQAVLGGEMIEVQGYEWHTSEGDWRLWYASNGFLVRYDIPLLDRTVHAELAGRPPRAIDEFPIPSRSSVETVDLP